MLPVIVTCGSNATLCYENLQEALDAATPGGELLLSPGTYAGGSGETMLTIEKDVGYDEESITGRVNRLTRALDTAMHSPLGTESAVDGQIVQDNTMNVGAHSSCSYAFASVTHIGMSSALCMLSHARYLATRPRAHAHSSDANQRYRIACPQYDPGCNHQWWGAHG